jgi:hypothetical protein
MLVSIAVSRTKQAIVVLVIATWVIATSVVLASVIFSRRQRVIAAFERTNANAVGDATDSDPIDTDAIARGLSYLRRNPSDVSALVVLDYLQRKYGLPADLAFHSLYAGPLDTDRLRVWGRMVGENRLVNEASLGSLTPDPGVEPMVMHALYCDRYPPPANYGQLLERMAARGDYELTHASLVLKILRDNRCDLPGATGAGLAEKIRLEMRELVDRAPRDPRYQELDVRYEALAFLQDFSADRSIPDAQFTKLVREQQRDGGWKPQPDQPSRPHPTVLAVWVLLARGHPDAPEIRFARR